MTKEESCCPICEIVNEYLDEIKQCETEEELELCVRKVVETAFDSGYKEFLIQNIAENIQFLEYLEEKEESIEQDKPNLRVVDNVNTNKH